MNNRQMLIVLALIAGVALIANSLFVVDERQRVALLQLGEIKGTDYAPGLHFKMPLVQNVRYFDRRILTLDNPPERFLTLEKKNVKVDFFVKWKIADTAKFYRATGGFEATALDRLSDIINKGLRNEFGTRTIQQAVSGERTEIVRSLEENANDKVQALGIQLVDVRVQRIDLPDEVSSSVYDRMRAERKRVASELRARGAQVAEEIRADADRQREIILAEAYKKAEELRGAGDARAADIYAKAYGKDEEFYRFYRSLNVYRDSWRGREDVLVLEPDSEFFRYFNGGSKK